MDTDTDPYRDTGKMCLGRGMHCPSASTSCLKKVPHLACYNFGTCEQILIFFCRRVTDKVRNQKMLYYATSNNLCFCTTWQNGETRKLNFSLKYCISALSFNSRLILTLLNVVINADVRITLLMANNIDKQVKCSQAFFQL